MMQKHTKSNSIKALQYCVFDNPSYYFGLVKSIKKPPFSLALQTRVHCLSLCIVAKDWLVFSRMVAFFHPWKIQLSCFRFPRGCIFHPYSGNFYFCWLTSTMTKTYHLDPATPQNHFLQQVILRHLSILMETQQKKWKNISTLQLSQSNGGTKLTNRPHPEPVA